MVKPLSHIVAEPAVDNIQPVLSIRVGVSHCCFAITDMVSQKLQQLTYYTADTIDAVSLADMYNLHAELQGTFYKILIGYDYPQTAVVPAGISADDPGAFLKSVYVIDAKAVIVSESLPGWAMQNIYAVPADVFDWLKERFPSARYWGQHAIDIKQIAAGAADGCIRVDFRKEDIAILVTRESKLLLAQNFAYAAPEDVVYYLLKTCRQFGLSQQTVLLELSGLVDKKSAMYHELYQYFIHIGLKDAGWSIPGSEYPAHFFTSLNNLAACAS